VLFRVIFTCDM